MLEICQLPPRKVANTGTPSVRPTATLRSNDAYSYFRQMIASGAPPQRARRARAESQLADHRRLDPPHAPGCALRSGKPSTRMGHRSANAVSGRPATPALPLPPAGGVLRARACQFRAACICRSSGRLPQQVVQRAPASAARRCSAQHAVRNGNPPRTGGHREPAPRFRQRVAAAHERGSAAGPRTRSCGRDVPGPTTARRRGRRSPGRQPGRPVVRHGSREAAARAGMRHECCIRILSVRRRDRA
jgi:hypothetical protein